MRVIDGADVGTEHGRLLVQMFAMLFDEHIVFPKPMRPWHKASPLTLATIIKLAEILKIFLQIQRHVVIARLLLESQGQRRILPGIDGFQILESLVIVLEPGKDAEDGGELLRTDTMLKASSHQP